MTVSKTEIERIAKLARVIADRSEVDQLAREIDAIVEFVSQLSTVDVADPPSAYRPGPVEAPLRKDVIAPMSLARPIESFAPQCRDGFFLVPRLEGVGGE